MPVRNSERKQVTDKVIALLRRVRHSFVVKLHGESMQRAGLPDVMALLPRPNAHAQEHGYTVPVPEALHMHAADVGDIHWTLGGAGIALFVECKVRGGTATPLQLNTLRQINASGSLGMVIDNPAVLEAWLKRKGWTLRDPK